MLVPVIWFEESAMIPEESAQKFKSLYTDRIRMVNIILSSMFVAALGLLAIDARLLASQYSHFKVTESSDLQQGDTGSNKSTKSGSTLGKHIQMTTPDERRQSVTSVPNWPLLAPVELAILYKDTGRSVKPASQQHSPLSDGSSLVVISAAQADTPDAVGQPSQEINPKPQTETSTLD